ncbi:MAG: uracil-DNA glycosylase [Actinobacteria bacterium]|nr:uracil-DNA glycosylase [Actinomycetota bacterium]
MTEALGTLAREVAACTACPRLVAWRTAVGEDPPARYRGQEYWSRGVPGFGDDDSWLFIVGLAPAAHGANRTGRMFTGDRSADFLVAALHRAGLANQAESVSRDDGLRLIGCRMSAVVRCAPPDNKPTTAERDACISFLAREVDLCPRLRVVLCLGGFAWDGVMRVLAARGEAIPRPKPRFAHGAEAAIGDLTLLGTYHPSQQNTFTGRLTPEMLDAILQRAADLAPDGEVPGTGGRAAP